MIMSGGVVSSAVTTGESGNNLYIIVIDEASAKPITQGVCITGSYNTTCCNCWGGGCSGCNGCTSGSGGPVSGYTGNDGVMVFSYPFTCPASFSLLLQTPGYQDELLQFDTGPVDGPINFQAGMSTGTPFQLGQEPPQCLGLWADLGQTNEQTGQTVTKTGSSLTGALSGLGLYAVIGLALIVVLLIILAATGIIHMPSQGGINK